MNHVNYLGDDGNEPSLQRQTYLPLAFPALLSLDLG